MLVLSRKENQEVHLPGLDVRIRVLKAGKSSIKLGIEAPAETKIIRGELNSLAVDSFNAQDERHESEFHLLRTY